MELLTLLQSRRHWSGEELARRLEISPRTLRRDIGSLQDLGYPITTTRGTGGGYQLAPGGSLPPLVLSEDEAAAVVIALKEAATGNHPTEATAAVSALAKIVQVLPAKIRRRIDSLQRVATLPGPYGSPAAVDTTVLTTFALAARDHETLTFDYTDSKGASTSRRAQPHYVVSLDQRLYLIAHDLDRADWRIFRIDRASNPHRTRSTFTPKPLPADDPAEFVRAKLYAAWTVYEVTATVEAPAEDVQEKLGGWGETKPITEDSCAVLIPTSDLDWATFVLAALHIPFTIHGPAEAKTHAAAWGSRLTAAANP